MCLSRKSRRQRIRNLTVSIPAATYVYIHRQTACLRSPFLPQPAFTFIARQLASGLQCANGAGAATTRIMAAVLVERPGVFAVRAKIPQQSSEQAARRFTDIMQIAEADMKQMLGLA